MSSQIQEKNRRAADDRSKRPTVLLALEEYGSGSEDEEDPGPIAPPVYALFLMLPVIVTYK